MADRGRRNRFVVWGLIACGGLMALTAIGLITSAAPYGIGVEETHHGGNVIHYGVPIPAKTERPNRELTSVFGEPIQLLSQSTATTPEEPIWWMQIKRFLGFGSPLYRWTVVMTGREGNAAKPEVASDETVGTFRTRQFILQRKAPDDRWVYQVTYTVRWQANQGTIDPLGPMFATLRDSFTVQRAVADDGQSRSKSGQ